MQYLIEPAPVAPPAVGCLPAGRADQPGEAKAGRSAASLLRRIGAWELAIAGAAIAKFLAPLKALLLLLPKAKLLTVAGSAMVSVVAYALFWGWAFAVGFVILLFLHESGHALQLRREGIKASAPIFIPFLGAMIKADLWQGDALHGGPRRPGRAGARVRWRRQAASADPRGSAGARCFLVLAYVGFLLNLFNLLPVLPLDGGRAMAAMAPWMWFVGFLALIPMRGDPARADRVPGDHLRRPRDLGSAGRHARERARSSRRPTTACPRATACWSRWSTWG